MNQALNFNIYKTLDNSVRILFWPVDEFFVLFGPAILTIAFGNFWFLLNLLFFLPYKKFKKQQKHFPISHWFYWNLPTNFYKRTGTFKNLPPSHLRELII